MVSQKKLFHYKRESVAGASPGPYCFQVERESHSPDRGGGRGLQGPQTETF